MRWETVQIGQISKVISGFAFKSKDFQPIGTPVIKIKNIKNENITLDESDCVDSAIEVPIRFHLVNGDILISLTGSHITLPSSVVGRVARYRHDTNSYLNQRAGKFINIDNERCLNDFLFYFLLQQETTTRIALKAQGAANQANISPSDVEGVEINLPPLPTQRKIATILSAYDDLIENNLKRIKLLEEKAFVTYKGIVSSEKLEEKSILDICYITDGTHDSPKQEVDGIYLVTGKHLIGGSIDFTSAYYISEADHDKIQKRSKIVNGDLVLSNIGTIGNVAIIDSPFEFSVKNVIIFKPNNEEVTSFLYGYLNSDEMQLRFQQESSGTSQRFLSLTYARGLKVKVPCKEVLSELHHEVSMLLKLKAVLNQQNTKLREARDILLPRLINGQIEV
jgi:type I restriction enzyme S subunit